MRMDACELSRCRTFLEDNDDRPDKQSLPWLPAELLGIVDIPQSSTAVQSLLEASCGLMENGWEVGWSLASCSRGPQHIIGNSLAQELQMIISGGEFILPESVACAGNPSLMGQSATRIALLAFPLKQSMEFWILEELDKPNEHLSSIWALMPPLYPKPASVLPEPSQIPIEDNSKVTRGSRFSKFAAERNKLLKNMAQPAQPAAFPVNSCAVGCDDLGKRCLSK